MREYRFCIVDVFAEAPYRGNQLAVVFDDGTLSDRDMLEITREMHYSETVFISLASLRATEKGIRTFTPPAEVPFAGHPCHGAAYCINKALHENASGTDQPQDAVSSPGMTGLLLKTKAGLIPISVSQSGDTTTWWMEQLQPDFGEVLPASLLARILGLAEDRFDSEYPAQWVSTGLPFVIVPLRGIDAVRQAKADWELFHELLPGVVPGDILVFTDECDDDSKDLHVRVLVDFPGIPEDPATGSANGCLAAYLLERGYMGQDSLRYQAEQGIEMGRPSVLHVTASKENGKFTILVGGEVHLVAEGTLYR